VLPRRPDLAWRVYLTRSPFIPEKPSVKFGEALRDQVEERLKFFETGEPPSKNAEAIRRVLEAIALEDMEEEGSDEEEDEEEMNVDDSPRKDAAGFSILPLIEVSPPAEPSPKKKGKKRKGDDMDVDRAEEEEEEVPRKKVKLSKEEKKALKKELKRKKKEQAASVRHLSFPFSRIRVH
jgi:nucleolar protein 56